MDEQQDAPAAWAAFQRGSSTGAETSSKHCVICTKIKMVLSARFFPCGHFLRGVTFWRQATLHIQKRTSVPWVVLGTWIYLIHFLLFLLDDISLSACCTETLLPCFEIVFTVGIFLYWFLAKAFGTWIIVWVLHQYSWMKAQWYNGSATIFFFCGSRNDHW